MLHRPSQSLFGRLFGLIRQFPHRLAMCALVVGAVGVTEALVLRWMGVSLGCGDEVKHVSIGDVSMSTDEEHAVLVLHIATHASSKRKSCLALRLSGEQRAVRLCQLGLEPYRVAILPREHAIAVAYLDETIRIWPSEVWTCSDIEQPRHSPRIFARVSSPPTRLQFSPCGKYLAAETERLTYIWSWPEGKVVLQQPRHCHGLPGCVSFASDDRYVVFMESAHQLEFHDLHERKVRMRLQPNDPLESAALSPDASRIAIAETSHVALISSADGSELWRYAVKAHRIVFLPDNRNLAVLSIGIPWQLSVLDCRTGKLVRRVHDFESPATVLSVSAGIDGANGVLCAGDVMGRIRAWGTTDFRKRWQFDALAWAKSKGGF